MWLFWRFGGQWFWMDKNQRQGWSFSDFTRWNFDHITVVTIYIYDLHRHLSNNQTSRCYMILLRLKRLYYTSYRLDLENVGSEDEGQYSCTMNGFNGTETFFEKRGFVLKRASYNNGYQGKIKPKFQKVFTANESRLLVNSTLNLSCPFTSKR